ncbi:DNA photolyase family protein [Aldersonia sp. NBC_00410]|uniref:cryptochrome/photolyase family protein n=1 Tax=Aldersonia sp. NBC_00410 TaxID=2975954 RepID=UPI002258EA22|nr:deoxyribodipyrimidine photo-lyase [Aldersonia sp. NBC_00410]MCX5042930.1 DNA photolyase family protein [Aldersonia sp. NBC_00410]
MDGSSVIWFRRDLRLADLPTLTSAAASSRQSVALFVVDDRLLAASGAPRRTFLFRCLRALDASLDGRLLVVRGDPAELVPLVAKRFGAAKVHVSADFAPYGEQRDAAVAAALGPGIELMATGSPYAVSPGRVVKADGTPYRVFTPFRRAWAEHGWRAPAKTSARTVGWLDPGGYRRRIDIPGDDDLGDAALPDPGESGAVQRWRRFRDADLAGYAGNRDRPDLDSTSRMSAYLKFGCIHPRTLLQGLGASEGATALRDELAWREFYADVLHHRPETARENYNHKFDAITYDNGKQAEKHFTAWCSGHTGYPIVDAGMRQLIAEGWMHNRLRMITASFLTKDLHLPWWWGARHFMRHLIDGDLASNQHGWQWTAGSGTDAAPYFRVFNPTTQGEKFDPHGDYVRRWVPELRGVPGKKVHALPDGPPAGYPAPLVDHKHEREIALQRYAALGS